MNRLCRLMFLWGVLLAGCWAFGQDDAVTGEVRALKKENADLRERVQKMEAAIAELQAAAKKAAAPAPTPTPAAPPSAPAKPDGEKFPVQSKKMIEIYGYLKADLAYDTGRMDVGNYAKWVLSGDRSEGVSDTSVTAQESRIGLNFNGPDVGSAKTTGKLEMDFASQAGGENKPYPQLRHAWLQISWPKHDFSVLAGQTWDVISPLVPGTINYSVGWWAGNIGYRRPQFRATKGFKLTEKTSLTFQCAVARTIGRNSGANAGDSGALAGFPTVQARMAVTFPGLGGKKGTIGVSGHWGREKFDVLTNGKRTTATSESFNFDASLPLAKKVQLLGEYFNGQDLDSFLGGVGQGINLATLKPIPSQGGWASLAFGPFGKWTFNVGASVDDPADSRLVTGERTKNRYIFGNFYVNITNSAQFGLELSDWRTEYKNKLTGHAFRIQPCLVYRF